MTSDGREHRSLCCSAGMHTKMLGLADSALYVNQKEKPTCEACKLTSGQHPRPALTPAACVQELAHRTPVEALWASAELSGCIPMMHRCSCWGPRGRGKKDWGASWKRRPGPGRVCGVSLKQSGLLSPSSLR